MFEIIIPTRNRKDCALSRLAEFKATTRPDTSLLLSDNQSDDNTFTEATCHQSSKIRIRQTIGEPSFVNNIMSSLLASKAEWAILCSDEDSINTDALDKLASVGTNPNVDIILGSVTPQEQPFRGLGRTHSDGNPDFKEIVALTYISGICFRTESHRDLWDSIFTMASDDSNFFLQWYPHQALIWLAFVQGSLAATSEVLITRGASARSSLPVKIVNNSKQSFFLSVEGRWRNWMGANEWIQYISTLVKSDEAKKRYEKLKLYHEQQLLGELKRGITHEYPDGINAFETSIRVAKINS